MNDYSKPVRTREISSDRVQVWIVATIWCVLFGLLFTLGGCAPDDGQTSSPESRDGKPSEVFSAIVEPLPNPNKYAVSLKWSVGEAPLQWIIHRKEGEQKLESTQVAAIPGTQNEIKDTAVEPGKEYTYYLGAVQDPHYTLKGKANAAIPTDLEIRGETSLKGNMRGNRLFLRDGAKLSTLGEALSFEVNEIISGYAVIDTSPAVATSVVPSTNGRSCGALSIKAGTATGRLTVQCKAENGTNGVDGPNGRNGNAGAQGSPGDVDVKPNEQLPVHKDAAQRAQLKHWYVTNTLPTGPVRPDGWKLWFYCSRPPGDGAPGEAGATGADGSPGGDGGNTGSIFVDVKTDSNFQVRTELTAGDGGTGGRGGNGGKGAPGGPPGNPDPSGFLCPQAKVGPPGPDALSGRPGRYGQKGSVRTFCIRVGGKVTGECK